MDLKFAVKYSLKIYLPVIIDEVAYFSLLMFSNIFITDIDHISPSKYLNYISDEKKILFFAGDKDLRAPLNDISQMSDLKANSQLFEFNGAHHQSLLSYDKKKYLKYLFDLCKSE